MIFLPPRAVLALIFLCAPGISRASANSRSICPGCNVILISLDTLRADALGVLGSTRAATPNLDAAARRGALFTAAFSQAPVTFPSHMSLFTGLHPWRHQANVPERDVLADRIPTLPQLLRDHGYRTFWFASLTATQLDLKAGFAKGFEKTLGGGGPGFSRALTWLRARPPEPFFSFLHNDLVHDPYTPKTESVLKLDPKAARLGVSSQEELANIMRQRVLAYPPLLFRPETIASYPNIFGARPLEWSAIEPLLSDRGNLHTSIHSLMSRLFWERFPSSDPATRAKLRLLYDSETLELDESIGLLLRTLKASGLEEKTLVVITSDHGEEFYEHGRNMHQQLYVECLHVPLIFLVPGMPGRRIEQIVQNIDVLPTILDAVGAPVPPGLDGISLVPAMRGEALPEPRRALAFWRYSFSARDSAFAYITRPGNYFSRPKTEALYDRRADPGETRNLLPARSAEAELYRALIPNSSTTAPKGAWPARLSEGERGRILKTGYW